MKKLLVLLIFTASYAHAEIYTWTDRGGTKHYTNSIYEIPEKYRAKAKTLDLGIVEKNDNTAGQQPGSQQQPNPPSAPLQQNPQVQPTGAAQMPQRTHEHQRREQPGKRYRTGTATNSD